MSVAATATAGFSSHATRLATFQRQQALFERVRSLKIKERRDIFAHLRYQNINENYFLPQFGLTIGEFSVLYLISIEKKPHGGGVAGANAGFSHAAATDDDE